MERDHKKDVRIANALAHLTNSVMNLVHELQRFSDMLETQARQPSLNFGPFSEEDAMSRN